MTNKQAIKTQPEHKNGHKPQPVAGQQQTNDFAAVAELPGKAAGTNGTTNIETQASRLNDARFQAIQRQKIASQIGQVQGNQHLQRVIQAATRNGNGHTNGHKSNGHSPDIASSGEAGELDGLGSGGSLGFAGSGLPPNGNGKNGNGHVNVQKANGHSSDIASSGEAGDLDSLGSGGSLGFGGAGLPPNGNGENGHRNRFIQKADQEEQSSDEADAPSPIADSNPAQTEETQSSSDTQKEQLETGVSVAPNGVSASPSDETQQVSEQKTESANDAKGEQVAEVMLANAPAPPAPEKNGVAPEEETFPKETTPEGELKADKSGEQGSSETELGPTQDEKTETPASPAEDPAFQAVIGRGKHVAFRQGHNNPAQQKAVAAQAAAKGPSNEVASQAAAAQVGKMSAQESPPFDKAAFKSQLRAKVQEITPKNQDEINNFKSSGVAAKAKDAVDSAVKQSKEKSQGPLEKTAKESPDASAGKTKDVKSLPPNNPGPTPPDIGANQAAPKPKGKNEIEGSLAKESASLDQQMVEKDITEEQLEKSNEPEFQSALKGKQDAQNHAKESSVAFREGEKKIIGGAKAEAVGLTAEKTGEMYSVRQDQFGQITKSQTETKGEDEKKRAEVASKIESIYKDTKQKVEARLAKLDTDVNRIFDEGAAQARRNFDNYVDEQSTWVEKLLQALSLSDEIQQAITRARNNYVAEMDRVIDNIANTVEVGLREAKALVAAGEQEVAKYVASLPRDLKQVGEKAANEIQGKFDKLRQDVDEKKNKLIDSLAEKYVANLAELDKEVERLREENRSLMEKAKEGIVGTYETITKMKEMLSGVLASAASALDKIIKDPIGFLGNLLSGIKMGLSQFVGRIGTHLKKGLMSWLFGEAAKSGIQLPESFDLKGILSLALQILGITWANLRARAVAMFGEKVVAALEKAWAVFQIIQTQGIGGLWEYIKEQLSNLKDMVLDGIKDMVITQVIQAGIKWLIGILGGPAGAFVKACMAIYDIVMWFVNNGSRLLSLVQAVVSSVTAVAAGNIAGAANFVENALSQTIPTVIGFLASLLGLGNLGEKIKGVIQKIQEPVNKAIDWVLGKAKAVVKKLAKMLGIGKDKEAEGGSPEQNAKARKLAHERVAQATQQPFQDEKALKGTIKKIESDLIPEGLKSLQVAPRKEQPGHYDIIARSTEDVGDAQVGDKEVDTSPITATAETAPELPAAKPKSATSLESIDPNIRATLENFWQQQITLRPDKKIKYEKYINNIKSGKRPSPTQSEMEMAFLRGKYSEVGESRREVPFMSGREVEGRPKGHTRPDVLDPLGTAVEVKRYLIKNKSGLISKLKKQINDRYEGLPYDRRKKQGIIVDLRGQGNIPNDQIVSLKRDIASATNLPEDNIDIVIW